MRWSARPGSGPEAALATSQKIIRGVSAASRTCSFLREVVSPSIGRAATAASPTAGPGGAWIRPEEKLSVPLRPEPPRRASAGTKHLGDLGGPLVLAVLAPSTPISVS